MKSVRLEVFGNIEDRMHLMDLAHCFSSMGMGENYSGYGGDAAIFQALLDAHRAGRHLELFAPSPGSMRGLTEGMNAVLPACIKAGLSCRAHIYAEHAGYRYRDSSEEMMLVATPQNPEPEQFEIQDSSVVLTLKQVFDAHMDGTLQDMVAGVKERSMEGMDLPGIVLGPDILEWLGEPAPAPRI